MQVPEALSTRGRPPIPDAKWNEVCDLAERGVPPQKAIEITGLGKTKVYEIYRNPIKREGRAPETSTGQ